MSATQPVSMYAMRVPPGDIMVPALPQFAAAMGLRVTMAAIDPSEEVVVDAADRKPRATLKIITIPSDMLDEDDSELDEDEEDDEDDLEANGGPSDKKLSRKIREAMEEDSEEDDEDMDEDDEEDEAEAQKVLAKLMKASKGKAVAGGDEDEDSEEDDDDDMLGGELDECVVCTLDPEKQYQQPLDFTIAGGERIFFKVSGTHTIHLTGNYVMPLDEPEDEDEEDDYDEDEELDGLDDLLNGDDESDELDDLDDPRVMELDSEEEAKVAKKAEKVLKGKNKRTAPDSDNEETALNDVMAKIFNKGEPAAAAAAAPTADVATSEEKPKKMSKAEKKAAKKLKNNEGEATAAPEAKPEEKKDTAAKVNGTTPESDKKSVKFAKNLEQGPTPSGNKPAEKPAEKKTSSSLGVRDVQGVTVDDRKVGTGPAAKKGSRLEMRYIGKLENGKVFDSNKSGKPFSLKLGAGDVIKGWDIGLAGMSAGGERRLTIPPAMAYGKKAMPGIPANSKLIFDVKCLSVK